MIVSRYVLTLAAIIGVGMLCAGHALAEEAAEETKPESGFTCSTSACTKGEPEAVKPKKPLGSFIKDYAKDYEPEPVEEKPLIEKQDALKGATFDEGEYYKGKTESGFKKTKEDFVDPKGVMTK